MAHFRGTARCSLLVAVIAACCSALGVPHAAAQMPAIGPETRWAIAPWFFPTGAEITFVDGNPNIDEAFLVRLAFPKNYRIPPHYHGTDIHVEVQQGAMAIGFGDRMDLHQTRVLAAGDTASVQAGTHLHRHECDHAHCNAKPGTVHADVRSSRRRPVASPAAGPIAAGRTTFRSDHPPSEIKETS